MARVKSIKRTGPRAQSVHCVSYRVVLIRGQWAAGMGPRRRSLHRNSARLMPRDSGLIRSAEPQYVAGCRRDGRTSQRANTVGARLKRSATHAALASDSDI